MEQSRKERERAEESGLLVKEFLESYKRLRRECEVERQK